MLSAVRYEWSHCITKVRSLHCQTLLAYGTLFLSCINKHWTSTLGIISPSSYTDKILNLYFITKHSRFSKKIIINRYQSSFYTVSFFLLFTESEKVFKPEVRRQEKYLTPDMNRRRLIDRAKMKSLRMSVVIVAAFIIWWTPYYIMMIIFTFANPNKDVSNKMLNWYLRFIQPYVENDVTGLQMQTYLLK